MDYGKVFRRSWHMVTRYRALWIFGIVLGLVTFSWGGVMIGNSLDDENRIPQSISITRVDGETFYDALERTVQRELAEVEREFDRAQRDFERFLTTELGIRDWDFRLLGQPWMVEITTVLAVLAGACILAVVVRRIARYVSEAALIRMVGEYEDTGERRGVRQGLRLGFSRTGWRLFLIDLVIDVPVFLAYLALLALAITLLVFGVRGEATAPVVAGSVLAGGFFLVGIPLAILIGTLLSVLKRFFRRACALEGLGVFASIRRGWAVVRRNPSHVLLMWFIMLGVSLGWAVVVALSFLVLFPLLIVTITLGGAAGALLGYLVFLLSSLLFEGALPVLLAVLVGLPIFILVMLAPWTCLGGLMEVFQSSAWTLTYRELRTVEDAQPDPVRAVEAASVGAAPAA